MDTRKQYRVASILQFPRKTEGRACKQNESRNCAPDEATESLRSFPN